MNQSWHKTSLGNSFKNMQLFTHYIMKSTCSLLLLLLPLAILSAEDKIIYYTSTLDQIETTAPNKDLPSSTTTTDKLVKINRLVRNQLGDTMFPYAVGKNGEVFYLSMDGQSRFLPNLGISNLLKRIRIATSGKGDQPPSGTLYLPNKDWSKMEGYPFQLSTVPVRQKEAKAHYLQIKISHYQRLQNLRGPGTAWYRHQIQETRKHLDAIPDRQNYNLSLNGRTSRAPNVTNMTSTYNLVSGGRAVSENLQLDRDLRVTAFRTNKEEDLERSVDVSSIEGITIEEIDWENRIDPDKPVTPSLLAKCTPHDQYFLHFETFQQLVDLIDNSLDQGTPLLRLLEPRSENAQTLEKYQDQLAMSLDDLVRKFGPELINSVAITGTDPYFRTGTDLTILIHANEALSLHTTLKLRRKQIELTAPQKPKASKGKISNVSYELLSTPDNSIRSYLVRYKDVVIVTNSENQIQKILSILKKPAFGRQGKEESHQSIADLQEYTWFRQRYTANDQPFFLITDAAIRQWCSPKWRIGNSRRTQAAAILAEIQARSIADQEELSPPEWLGAIENTSAGPQSSIYGNLAFLTPISELEIEKVTPQEQRAYNNFRNRYQNRWRNFFDPIGGTLSIMPDQVQVDLTVLPLIAQSEYNESREITGDVKFESTAASPSPDSLLHGIIALDMQGQTMRRTGSFLSRTSPTIGTNALGWLGKHASIQLMESDFWGDLADFIKTGEDPEDFLEANIHRFPALAKLDVNNPFLMTTFLGTFRAFLDQTSPGMLVWDNLTHKDQTFVRIGLSEKTKKGMRDTSPWKEIALYYRVQPTLLTVSLREDLIKQSIDQKEDEEVQEKHKWLGGSMGFQVNGKSISTLQSLTGENLVQTLQSRSWSNLHILNEWRREKSQQDAVGFHKAKWHTILTCPGGGTYQWNKKFQTYESTVFGCPAKPGKPENTQAFFSDLEHLSFGITFEDDGLRARTRILRNE